MVATNRRHVVEGQHALDDRGGIAAVAHEIAEAQRGVIPEGSGIRQHGLERLGVRVNVADDQVAHWEPGRTYTNEYSVTGS